LIRPPRRSLSMVGAQRARHDPIPPEPSAQTVSAPNRTSKDCTNKDS